MKLTSVFGAMPGYELGLNITHKLIADTLLELGEEVEQINLGFSGIPNFDGVKSKSVEPVMQSIMQSDGVIFAATTIMNSPCALFKTFIEYFVDAEYANALKGKNCMIVTTSQKGGERATIEYLSNIIGQLGGFDAVRICINSKDAEGLYENKELKEIIERQTEDFYRILRQNRKFIIPVYQSNISAAPLSAEAEAGESAENGDNFTDEEYFALFGKHKRHKANLEELYQKHNIETETGQKQEEIEEIANYFVQKFIKEGDGIVVSDIEPIAPKSSKAGPPKPRAKTCKQLTQSLPHHFNPQSAAGVKAVFQLNISGADGFEGYIEIDNADCAFYDGQAEKSDIIILADDKSWIEIIKGKYTAQKAFMIGRLKVRGNFMLLTKFDTFFSDVK